MYKKLLSAAFFASILSSPASATVITVNLSGTDAATAVASVSLQAGTTYVLSLVQATYTAVAVASPSAGNYVDYYKYSTVYNADGSGYNYYGTLSTRYATAADAFAAYSAQAPLTLTFPTTTTLYFQIGDSLTSLYDNTGGTSISVASVPEPASWAMMLAGFGVIGFAARQRRKVSVSYS